MKGMGWLFQRFTGVILIAGLILHFSVMHFSGEGQINYEIVVRRLSSLWWKGFDLIFLLAIVSHGFNGLWGIALEYAGSDRKLKFFEAVIILSIISLLATGVYIITL